MKSKRAIFLRKFGKITGYIVVFSLFSAGVYWFVCGAFTIKNIIVVGNNIRVEVDETKLPKTLLLFPSGSLRAQLLLNNPILEDIQFKKKYPHTLLIVPSLRAAVIRLKLIGREVIVSESAIVLADADPNQKLLPRVTVPLASVRIGEKIKDPRVVAAVSFIIGVGNILPIQSISAEDGLAILAKSDKLDIIFAQDTSMPDLLATLQTLLSGFRIKGTLPTLIDLRFNKPIIKF